MKINYRRIRIGRRTLKSAIAVVCAMVLVTFWGSTSSRLVFAMLGAMDAMQPSFKKSLQAVVTQISGITIGAIIGLLLYITPLHPLLCVGIGIVIIISLYNALQIPFSPVLPCLIIVSICTGTDAKPWIYVLGRLWDTFIGLGIGILINMLIFPYDNSLKIKNAIQHLEIEVIGFFEVLFDGQNICPDIRNLSADIDSMASELGIYSDQWIPLKGKRNQEDLEAFRVCEWKSRQLLAHLEVLSRMEIPGALSDENRKFLKTNNAHILDDRIMNPNKEQDIITNYHVSCVLQLRKELMEILDGLSMK